MARKTNTTINGKEYYRITRTVGHKIGKTGFEVPIKKQFYGASKKEAEQKYEEYMRRLKSGYSMDRQYFGQLADNWIDAYFRYDDTLASTTRDKYLGAWQKYVTDQDFYSRRIDEVKASDLQLFYNTVDAPKSAIAAIHKLMRRFYRYLDMEGIARDVTSHLRLPKDKNNINSKKIEVWSSEEIYTLLTGFDKATPQFRLRFLIVLLYETGMRISEALGLKLSDFDLENRTVTISRQLAIITDRSSAGVESRHRELGALKTPNAYRTLPISDNLIEELEKHKAWQKEEMVRRGYRTDMVFTTKSGEYMDKVNVQTALGRYYAAVGVPKKPIHTYRHTFGTELCRRGVPIQVASRLLGHSNISVTAQYYVEISTDDMRDAIQKLTHF